MAYRDFLPSAAPNWLQGKFGTRLLTSIGEALDRIVTCVREAVLARYASLAASDGVPALGNERLLERGRDELESAFRTRILNAWDDWSLAGGGQSLLRALRSGGYVNVALVQQNGIGWTLDGSGNAIKTNLSTNPLIAGTPPWWSFDLNDAFWNRFAVLFYPAFPAHWIVSGTHPTATVTLAAGELDSIRRTVDRWKPGKALCVGLFVLTDGESLAWPVGSLADGPTLVPAGALHGNAVVRFDC